MKIAIVTDSGSGLTKKEANDLGIYYLPLQILVKDQMYLDGENITLEKVYRMLEEGEMPTTSMPPVGIIEEVFEQIQADGYDEVMAIPLSGGLSSTASIMQAAAKEYNFSLHIVEIYTTCEIQKYLTLCAQNLVKKGKGVEEIISKLNESIVNSDTLIVPNDLQHLKRGGRLTPLAAALGGLLKIKPILQLNKQTCGKIDVFDKVRTLSKALSKAVSTFAEKDLDDSYRLILLHSKADEEVIKLKELMEKEFPNIEIILGDIGPVVSVHTGLGCIGIQRVKKIIM